MAIKRIGVLTGGGDTCALNATLRGIADKCEEIGVELVGLMRGWAGLLRDGVAVRLHAHQIDPNVGGTVLKTSRTKLPKVERGFEQAQDTLARLGIDALIPIGGDDTLSVARQLPDFPIVVVTKTIDNDVGGLPPPGDPIDYDRMTNYFTPGFPSAARFAARLVSLDSGLRTTAYSHERIVLAEAMGMSAGWLALAAGYGRPDLVVIPEVPLVYDRFVEALLEVYRRQKHVVAVVAEGATYEDGQPIYLDQSNVDAFGHAKAGGCCHALAQRLKSDLGETLGTRNFNAVIPSYLFRCGSPAPVDGDLAVQLGGLAVDMLAQGQVDAMACVARRGDRLTVQPQVFDALPRRPDGTIIPRRVDPRFYDAQRFAVTEAGLEYLRPILGPRPPVKAIPTLEPLPVG